MEHEILQILQALLECIGKYPDGNENKEWFTKLIQYSLNGQTCPDTDSDLFYNATMIEHILSTILAIDIKTIVKIRMVHKVILTMWEENNGDMSWLSRYILDEKPKIPNSQPITETNHSLTEINQTPPCSLLQHPTQTYYNQFEEPPSETNIEEITMKENNENNDTIETSTNTPPTLDQIEQIPQITIGEDIASITHYGMRNRKSNPINPFFITKSKNFRLGILAVNAPGNNKSEQLNYIANILKIPKKNDLITFEFREGNNWITIGFDFEEDLIFCQDKLNTKEKEIIKFIRLSTNKGKKNIAQLDNNKGKNTTSKHKITINPHEPNSENTHGDTNNPFQITEKPTTFQGGFLTAKIPGENRKDQLDYISNALKISLDNNLISHTFHQGNSWITAYFNNSTDLKNCTDNINKNHGGKINMVILNKHNGNLTYKENFKKKEFELTKHLNPTQDFLIKDIPLDFSTNRVKGALKHFGNISNIKTINKSKNGKSIQVTIEPTLQSKDITNRWSIPLGSTMARIAPLEHAELTLKDRNTYTTRLYGLPKNTNTIILMQSLKHLNPKTCFIPRCSISGKERNFAIISFQTKKELDKACSSRSKYLNFKLTWSKSRTEHINNLSTDEQSTSNRFTLFTKPQYPKKSFSSFSFSSPNPSTTSENTPSEYSSHSLQKDHKKNKRSTQHYRNEFNNTTDKLIDLISKIANRLDYLENSIGIRPNRS